MEMKTSITGELGAGDLGHGRKFVVEAVETMRRAD